MPLFFTSALRCRAAGFPPIKASREPQASSRRDIPKPTFGPLGFAHAHNCALRLFFPSDLSDSSDKSDNQRRFYDIAPTSKKKRAGETGGGNLRSPRPGDTSTAPFYRPWEQGVR